MALPRVVDRLLALWTLFEDGFTVGGPPMVLYQSLHRAILDPVAAGTRASRRVALESAELRALLLQMPVQDSVGEDLAALASETDFVELSLPEVLHGTGLPGQLAL